MPLLASTLVRTAGETFGEEAFNSVKKKYHGDGEDDRAAISTVLDTSMPLESWERPSETVQLPGSAARNSRANKNSFQAIMNTYRPVAIAALAGLRRRLVVQFRPGSPQDPEKAFAERCNIFVPSAVWDVTAEGTTSG
jgi:hypothetical protein